jgi:hypothetical protein
MESAEGVHNVALAVREVVAMEKVSDKTWRAASSKLQWEGIDALTEALSDSITSSDVLAAIAEFLPGTYYPMLPMCQKDAGRCLMVIVEARHSPELTRQDLSTLADLIEECERAAPDPASVLRGTEHEKALHEIKKRLRAGDKKALEDLDFTAGQMSVFGESVNRIIQGEIIRDGAAELTAGKPQLLPVSGSTTGPAAKGVVGAQTQEDDATPPIRQKSQERQQRE